MTCPTGGAQTLIMEKIIMEKIIMEKNNYGKTGQSALAP